MSVEGTALETRLSVTETELRALKRRLYGNGQPGDIQAIQSSLGKIEGSVKEANTKLGRVLLFLVGGGAVGGAGAWNFIQSLLGG